MEELVIQETLDECFLNLQIAILKQAEIDYIKAIRNNDFKTQREIERFYRSRWGKELTFNHSEEIIARIRREAATKMPTKRIFIK